MKTQPVFPNTHHNWVRMYDLHVCFAAKKRRLNCRSWSLASLLTNVVQLTSNQLQQSKRRETRLNNGVLIRLAAPEAAPTGFFPEWQCRLGQGPRCPKSSRGHCSDNTATNSSGPVILPNSRPPPLRPYARPLGLLCCWWKFKHLLSGTYWVPATKYTSMEFSLRIF